MTKPDENSLLKRIQALGPYAQDLSLLGLDVTSFVDQPLDSAVIFDLVRPYFPGDGAWTALDAGCNAGLFSFLCRRSGAARVVGVEFDDHFLRQARAMREYLHMDVEFAALNLETDELPAGAFTIVLALGLLYHLRDPFAGLRKLAEKADDWLLIETEVARGQDPRDSLAVTGRYRDDDSSHWLPGVAAIEQTLAQCGLTCVEARRIDRERFGAADYATGLSEGMLPKGERWFFAAQRQDAVKTLAPPAFQPPLRAWSFAYDERELRITASIEARQPGQATLTLHPSANPDICLPLWSGELAAGRHAWRAPATIAWADREYRLMLQWENDQVILPKFNGVTPADEDSAGPFAQRVSWSVNGIAETSPADVGELWPVDERENRVERFSFFNTLCLRTRLRFAETDAVIATFILRRADEIDALYSFRREIRPPRGVGEITLQLDGALLPPGEYVAYAKTAAAEDSEITREYLPLTFSDPARFFIADDFANTPAQLAENDSPDRALLDDWPTVARKIAAHAPEFFETFSETPPTGTLALATTLLCWDAFNETEFPATILRRLTARADRLLLLECAAAPELRDARAVRQLTASSWLAGHEAVELMLQKLDLRVLAKYAYRTDDGERTVFVAEREAPPAVAVKRPRPLLLVGKHTTPQEIVGRHGEDLHVRLSVQALEDIEALSGKFMLTDWGGYCVYTRFLTPDMAQLRRPSHLALTFPTVLLPPDRYMLEINFYHHDRLLPNAHRRFPVTLCGDEPNFAGLIRHEYRLGKPERIGECAASVFRIETVELSVPDRPDQHWPETDDPLAVRVVFSLNETTPKLTLRCQLRDQTNWLLLTGYNNRRADVSLSELPPGRYALTFAIERLRLIARDYFLQVSAWTSDEPAVRCLDKRVTRLKVAGKPVAEFGVYAMHPVCEFRDD